MEATITMGAFAGAPFWISGIMIHHFRKIAAGLLVQSRRMGRALSILCPTSLRWRAYLFREAQALMRTVLHQREGIGVVARKVPEEVYQTEEEASTSHPLQKAYPRMSTTGRTFSPCR